MNANDTIRRHAPAAPPPGARAGRVRTFTPASPASARDRLRRRAPGIAVLAAVLSTGLMLSTRPAGAGVSPEPFHTRTSSQSFAFSGLVFDEAAGEDVAITGTVHVVTRVHFDFPPEPGQSNQPSAIEVHANLNNTTGVGMTSGAAYQGYGSEKMGISPEPFLPATELVAVEFSAVRRKATGGERGIVTPCILPISLTLELDEMGELIGGRATIDEASR